jgi:3D-(3,5/4)-trihydroxycyclohexane-1,2-dione acylhydrolase (decyclizing)
VASYDAGKQEAASVVGDAGAVLIDLKERLGNWCSGGEDAAMHADVVRWNLDWEGVTAAPSTGLPSDAQVIGALWRNVSANAVVVCAAGGLPGELHKLWRARAADDYHVEYGYSCMGYEIAGGLGVKMAQPNREVHVLVGDGSYLMLNSELATSIALGLKLVVIVLNNRGFACINRLQRATGGAAFNTLWEDSTGWEDPIRSEDSTGSEASQPGHIPDIDFVAHAASLGAIAEKAGSIAALEEALRRAGESERTHVIVIDTDPAITTAAGGAWWDVAIPEVSSRDEVDAARAASLGPRKNRRLGD